MSDATNIYVGAAATKEGGQGGLFRRSAEGGEWQHVFTAADVHAITVHPHDQDMVFIGTKDGPYRSADRGAHWERVGFPDRDVQVWSILLDRRDPRTVYAGGSPVAVYRSDDGGEHFRRMPDPGLPNRVTMSFPCRVMRFATHPRNLGEVYATLEVNGAMRSRDAGETWSDCSDDLQRLSEQPRLKSRILSDTDAEGMLDGHAIAISEADPDGVILAVRMGLFHSGDQGKSWQDMQVGRFSPVHLWARYPRFAAGSENPLRLPFGCREQRGGRAAPQHRYGTELAAVRHRHAAQHGDGRCTARSRSGPGLHRGTPGRGVRHAGWRNQVAGDSRAGCVQGPVCTGLRIKEKPVAKGYVVAEIEVTDPALFEEYRGKVPATIGAYGGRYLVRGGETERLEGDRPLRRMVVLEFESPQRASEWYHSEEYRPLKALRMKASKGHMVLTAGLEGT